MTDIRADASQVHVFAARLTATSATAGARAHAVTRTYGQLLQTRVKARAAAPRSSPPGPEPRLQTGDYNRSITLQMTSKAGNPTAEVGTNKPQGRRLEFGFVGDDALGRHYNDPPRPHFGPAVDDVAGEFVLAIAHIGTQGIE